MLRDFPPLWLFASPLLRNPGDRPEGQKKPTVSLDQGNKLEKLIVYDYDSAQLRYTPETLNFTCENFFLPIPSSLEKGGSKNETDKKTPQRNIPDCRNGRRWGLTCSGGR